ncbi:CCA tRNA nucleotidyltransferase [Candidatus Pacearchaeota archaeon]|nr:CCA tRNA nucleotidyltransferase [Candidatus Pacearchaeota archaeon]
MFLEIISNAFINSGYELFIVGGCVRNELLGIKPKDYDLTTDATPEEIKNIFTSEFMNNNSCRVKIYDTGIEHLTLTLVIYDCIHKETFEITTYRVDEKCDGRHAVVSRAKSLKDDCSRRDFTINGIAKNPLTGEIIDFFGGIDDLNKRIIRAIGDPEKRLKEDWLRMLRAIRFSSNLGFEIDPALKIEITKHSDKILKISKERIRDEWFKILSSPVENIRKTMFLLEITGLMKNILPVVTSMRNFSQTGKHHKKDLYNHCIDVLISTARLTPDPIIRFAALIHDIGKLITRSGCEGSYRFKEHNYYGMVLSETICRDLKLKLEEINLVKYLIEHHLEIKDLYVACKNKFNKKLVSRFIVKHKDYLKELLLLGKADIELNERIVIFIEGIEEFYTDYTSENRNEIKSILKGKEIMEICKNANSGKWIGEIKNLLIEKQIEGVIKNREEAISFVKCNFKVGSDSC